MIPWHCAGCTLFVVGWRFRSAFFSVDGFVCSFQAHAFFVIVFLLSPRPWVASSSSVLAAIDQTVRCVSFNMSWHKWLSRCVVFGDKNNTNSFEFISCFHEDA